MSLFGSIGGLSSGSTVGKAVVELVGDSAKLKADLAEAKAQTAATQTGMQGFAQNLKTAWPAAAAVAGAAVIQFGVSSVKAFMEAEQVAAETEARLLSTGGAAGVTAEHIANLAGRIQDYSGISDEAIQSAENMLLTFTSVRNETGKGNAIFDRATKALTDMSAAGYDLRGTSIQLGKALNDPVKGMAALGRAGVQFTASQKEAITTAVGLGDTLKAQKIILAEVETQFGGTARAAGDTFAGKLNILKNNFNDIQEAVGGLIVDALLPVVEGINKVIDSFENFGDRIPGWVKSSVNLGEAIVLALPGVGMLATIGKLGEEHEKVADATGAAGQAAKFAAGEHAKLAEQMRKEADDARDLRIAQLSLADGFLGVQGSALSARDAQRDYAAAQAKVNRLQENGKADTEKYREAQRELKDAQLNAVQGQLSLAQSVASYIDEIKTGETSQREVNGLVRQYGRMADLSKGEVQGLIDRVQGLINKYDELPKEKSTRVVTYFEAVQSGVPTQVARANIASGGVIQGASGFITKGPTYLVGESTRRTFAGTGTEGVIPFDDRGIGILSEALSRAIDKGGSKRGRDDRPINLTIEIDGVAISRQVSLHQRDNKLVLGRRR